MKTIVKNVTLSIGSALLFGCTADDTVELNTPWPIESVQIAEPRVQESDVVIRACNKSFQTGKVWQAVKDKKKAVSESKWVATLDVGLENPIYPFYPSAPGDVEKAEQAISSTTKSVFERLGLEYWIDQRYVKLMVRGQPKQVLKAIEEDCSIVGFDLTGFHCDCAPEQCELANSCKTRFLFVDYPPERGNEQIITCTDDLFPGAQYAEGVIRDFRGIMWSSGASPIVVHSWINSSCNPPQ